MSRVSERTTGESSADWRRRHGMVGWRRRRAILPTVARNGADANAAADDDKEEEEEEETANTPSFNQNGS